ncbi:MAG: Crp/Fnr family transcriptional regulator [Novosphingobium sp.]
MDGQRSLSPDMPTASPGAAQLPGNEVSWLEAHWTREQLSPDRILCDTDCASETLWLLDDAVTARIAHDGSGHSFEIAVDGPGSLACGWLLSGDRLSPWRVQVRRGGTARRLKRSHIEALARFTPVFPARCRAVLHAEVLELAAQFALSRRRTARSLLADRLDGYFVAFGENAIAITHSTLANRLNLRRATVTMALQELEGARAIRSNRARIEIKDRARLRALAQEF